MNDIALGCYEDQDKYNIEIIEIQNIDRSARMLKLTDVRCPGHLGYEIYENDKLIDFSYLDYYIDENVYEEDYIPSYRIIAYDRLLYASKPSPYASKK